MSTAGPNERAAQVIAVILNRAREQDAATAITALEIITALRGHGWRPTNAQPQPGWTVDPATITRTPPPEWHQARQALKDRP